MPETPSDDSLLMVALQRGDESVLPLLIKRWERPLYSFSYRYVQNEQTARDIVEETIVRLFSKRDRYNPEYPLSTWLFTIASNLCKNHARWKKRHPEHPWEHQPDGSKESTTWEDKISSDAPTPIEETERNESHQLLKISIEQLPHDLKVVLLLHYYEGMSYKEISIVSNCSVRGIVTRLYRARKHLKVHYETVSAS